MTWLNHCQFARRTGDVWGLKTEDCSIIFCITRLSLEWFSEPFLMVSYSPEKHTEFDIHIYLFFFPQSKLSISQYHFFCLHHSFLKTKLVQLRKIFGCMSLKQRIISRSSWFSLQYSIESALLGVSNDLLMSVDSGNFDLILVQRPRATAYTRARRVKRLREWRGLHSTTSPLDAPLNPTHSSFNCDFLLAAKSPER